jgi:hemerythrin superfamily protein
MDAITLLKQDHKTVNGLFRQFEKLGDNATASKSRVVNEIVRELSIHAAIEETVFYPAVKGVSEGLTEDVLESLEEHHIVKWVCNELADMTPEDERFDAKVTVLIENVRHHVEEEEQQLFPQVREAMGRKELGELGELLEKAKKVAPTRPHPMAPDEPPLNAIASSVTALIDRLRDAGAKAIADARSRGRSTARRTRSSTKRPAAKRSSGRSSSSRSTSGRSSSRSRASSR